MIETGQIIGKWTVVSKARDKSASGNLYWTCKCSCGTESTVLGSALSRGMSTQCVKCKHEEQRLKLIGKSFYNWTVLERTRSSTTKTRRSWYLCKCSCGLEKEISIDTLKTYNGKASRRSSSTYCETCDNLSKVIRYKSVIDLSGKVFGDLVVLYNVEDHVFKSGKRELKWMCRCTCGNEQAYIGCNLRQGLIKKCSRCSQSLRPSTKAKAWESEFRAYIASNYRRRNKLFNNTTFDLTLEEFKTIASSKCYYCGNSPQTKLRSGKGLFRNSIDRLDNTKGYYLDNCVPACKTCNMMKKDHTFEIFLDQISRIYLHLYTKHGEN